jgi:hypothetical protein
LRVARSARTACDNDGTARKKQFASGAATQRREVIRVHLFADFRLVAAAKDPMFRMGTGA